MKKIQNNTIANLFNRTCCRTFTKEIVSDEIIKAILKAGQAAGSAKNRQPWYFLVIQNKTLREKITKLSYTSRKSQFRNFEPKNAKQMINSQAFNTSNDKLITEADFAILVFRNSDYEYKEGDREILDIKEEQSVAFACANILNAAYALGIGMYWNCSVLNFQNRLLEILKNEGVGLPNNALPRVLLPGGYPKRKLLKPKRKSLEEISKWII